MGLFSKAKDNYDKRKDIAEFNYRTREYISEGERIYEKAYEELRVACNKSADKADKYVRSEMANDDNSVVDTTVPSVILFLSPSNIIIFCSSK